LARACGLSESTVYGIFKPSKAVMKLKLVERIKRPQGCAYRAVSLATLFPDLDEKVLIHAIVKAGG
jgi:hypothetical protein